jgi:hypothetical protein
MRFAPARRALVAVAALTLLTVPAASAETVAGDGDLLTAGLQTTIDLGTATPGQDVAVNVAFTLTCTGTSHVDPGQSVRLTPGSITVPVGGSFGVGSLVFAPGAGWPADGEACPADLAAVTSPSLRVIVTAPPDPGTGYRYSFTWNRSLVPTGTDDSTVFGGTAPTLVFLLDVATNTPPSLDLPADMTVEGDTVGGAVAAYAVSASDSEDAVAPTPACSPAVGAVLPLGTTTVGCSVTDGGGLTTTGSFDITVVDTTAPVVATIADIDLTTSDPTGALLSYGSPTVADIVDAAPTVACLPADGTMIPVGTTTVTCTARDASGNQSTMSFDAVVTYVPAVSWTATWGEPVASSGDTFVANPGRSVPIKVEIFADGVEQGSGQATLTVTPCDGGPGLAIALGRDAGRWTGKLDTSLLTAQGCYTATASLDGHTAGGFRLELRASSTGTSQGGPKGSARR